ncbi:transposase [Streptomyces sp. NPDC089919]|uniref:IS701 family transposase n=1 Tax=Streptomyces sp. NPDC089919 TaxID=3155188 RepID=UPI003416F228
MSTLAYLPQATPVRPAPRPADPHELSAYCRGLFAVLPRSDQRRWGEVYVRGLLEAPGRKTPSTISAHVLGRPAVQQLQQFIGQSPWECGPVRRYVADRCAQEQPPRAWCVDEAVITKSGDRSVGVARQFAPSQERTVNCQLALVTSLVSADGAGVPVNWRLVLPQRWDTDESLRKGAHLPQEERCRPRWRYVVEALDEMLDDWGLTPAPVLADWRHDTEVEPLLYGLEARGLGYVIEVSGAVGAALPRPSATTGRRYGTLAELAEQAACAGPATGVRRQLMWPDPHTGRSRQSQFLTLPVVLGGAAEPVRLRAAPRHLVVDWPYGRPAPRSYRLTNLPPRRLAETVALAHLREPARAALTRLQDHHGLNDFEGRSFRGWHHHATLASAALGFTSLHGERDTGDRRERGAV